MSKKKPNKKVDKKKKEAKKYVPIKLPVKKILYFAVVIILILTPYLFLRNSRYFKLADIIITEKGHASGIEKTGLLALYKGRNIFNIDINSLSSRIESDYPVIERAVVKKALPNMLEVNIIPRVPVARIESHEYFPVDRTGMVLSPEVESKKLPVITGFSIWLNPRAGERLESRQLESAFLLVDALKERPPSSAWSVNSINVTNYRNLSFYLSNGIEVKIGQEDFPGKLRMLEETLRRRGLNKDNIKYIDLRFRDVVIGPK